MRKLLVLLILIACLSISAKAQYVHRWTKAGIAKGYVKIPVDTFVVISDDVYLRLYEKQSLTDSLIALRKEQRLNVEALVTRQDEALRIEQESRELLKENIKKLETQQRQMRNLNRFVGGIGVIVIIGILVK